MHTAYNLHSTLLLTLSYMTLMQNMHDVELRQPSKLVHELNSLKPHRRRPPRGAGILFGQGPGQDKIRLSSGGMGAANSLINREMAQNSWMV